MYLEANNSTHWQS